MCLLTEKELRKLNRQELLEVLLAQSKKIDRLQAKLQESEEKLKQRELTVEKAGSIADASLALNNVFADAQKAADQYLYNVRLMSERTERECADRKKSADKQIRYSLLCAKKTIRQMVDLYSAEIMKRMQSLQEWDRQMEALRERQKSNSAKRSK